MVVVMMEETEVTAGGRRQHCRRRRWWIRGQREEGVTKEQLLLEAGEGLAWRQGVQAVRQ
jgi:hypothetical protein